MSLGGRIDFPRSRPLPPPWTVFDAGGRLDTCIETPFTLRRLSPLERANPGRSAVRATLAEELQQAAQRRIRWEETPTGPRVLERIRHKPVGVSISYAKHEAWLAIGWEGPIGVDAVAIERVPDWEEVASVYMGRSALERLRKSPEPEFDFAVEWAAFEARLKLGGLSLEEGVEPPAATIYTARLGSQAVAVAARPGDATSSSLPGSARSGRCFVP